MKSIVTSCLCMLFSLSIFAQNLNVTPTKINFNLEPGETYQTEIVVRNTATTKQKVNLRMGNFSLDAEGASSFSDANNNAYSCVEWMTLSQSLIELSPNESKKIKLTMKVPANGTTTRWAMVFVEPAEEQGSVALADKSLSLGTSVTTRVGIPVFQSPRNSGTIKADIRNLKEIPNDSIRTFVTEVVNEGEKVIEGELFTVYSNIQTGEEVEAAIQTFTVLPRGSRNYRFVLPENLPKGKYILTVVLDYDDDADQEGVRLNVTVD